MRKLVHKRQPVPFDQATHLGILFDATLPQNRDLTLRFSEELKKRKKKVKLLGYFNTKQDINNFPFKAFNNTEMDWLLSPKGEVVEQFMDEPFDILICIYSGVCLPIEYISALSKAHLRVGPFTENTYCYDLMIDTAGHEQLENYLKQVDFYLNRLKSKKHETSAI